jgi:RNA polymerase sigma-70 factor (ECF subfamily)
MDALAARCTAPALMADSRLKAEFESALADSTRLVFRIAYSVLRQREDAEDVAQDVLVKAHARLAQLRDPTRFRAWLVRMTWRAALDRRTANLRRISRESHDVRAAVPTTEDVTIEAERAARLWSAIDALPEKLRLVVVLNAIEGHDIAEVAALLGVPSGTVKSRLFAARQQLREGLNDVGSR